jgi:hypothetical protein
MTTQPGPQGHRLHRVGGRPRRRDHHRHLGGRPGPHHPGAGDPETEPYDFTQPGHVFPLRYHPGGVLRRPGTPRRRRPGPDGRLCAGRGAVRDRVNDDGDDGAGRRAARFADEHGLTMISIADLIRLPPAAREAGGAGGRGAAPDPYGVFRALGYRDLRRERAHRAGHTATSATGQDVLVRVHSECLTGDVFGSLRCDCGPQLRGRAGHGGRGGRGVVLYMRGHEGRGSAWCTSCRPTSCRTPGATPWTRTSTGPAGRRPRLRHRRADPGRPGVRTHAAADQQPGQAGRAGGLRAGGRRAGAAAGAPAPRRTCATCAPSGTGWATTCPHLDGRSKGPAVSRSRPET